MLLIVDLNYQEIIKVIQPVLLGQMILYFESYDPENMTALYKTLGYAAGMSLCTIGLALLHHLYFYHVQRLGMKIRVAMCHMIYSKVSEWGKLARASSSKCKVWIFSAVLGSGRMKGLLAHLK